MKKKLYSKPEINFIELRTEERLAACDPVYYSNKYDYTATGNCDHWDLDSPNTCLKGYDSEKTAS